MGESTSGVYAKITDAMPQLECFNQDAPEVETTSIHERLPELIV